MTATESTMPEGERIRKAVRWISETCGEKKEKTRAAIIKEAEIRFDLTPLECEFLDRHFCEGNDARPGCR